VLPTAERRNAVTPTNSDQRRSSSRRCDTWRLVWQRRGEWKVFDFFAWLYAVQKNSMKQAMGQRLSQLIMKGTWCHSNKAYEVTEELLRSATNKRIIPLHFE
jgi:predicted NAD/FAD-dependent oxidoreductase